MHTRLKLAVVAGLTLLLYTPHITFVRRAQAAAHQEKALSGVERVSLVVGDLTRARALYRDALGFNHVRDEHVGPNPLAALFAMAGVSYRQTILRIGKQELALRQFNTHTGRRVPADSRSNDGWFQHLAIVVGDMDRSYARLLAHGVRAISNAGPQTIPASNPAAGGVRAFYFRDSDDHPLELIWFPEGKGDARWHALHGTGALGIDHTAIAAKNSARSRDFYRDVAGLHVAGESFNTGAEQAALSAVPGARVHITGLRGSAGPGVELLSYEAPSDGRPTPADTRPDDLWSSETQLRVASLSGALDAAARYGVRVESTQPIAIGGVRTARIWDPDGHALRLVERH